MSQEPINATSFWEFSLSFYKGKDVQHLLISLQDGFGLNVNVLLFCLYCDELNIKLSKLVLTNVLSAIKIKDAELIQHRNKRREAKYLSERDNQSNEMQYQDYLVQELALEKAQQVQIIEAYVKNTTVLPTKKDAGNEQTIADSGNLQVYVHIHADRHPTASLSKASLSRAEVQVMIQKLQELLTLREQHHHV